MPMASEYVVADGAQREAEGRAVARELHARGRGRVRDVEPRHDDAMAEHAHRPEPRTGHAGRERERPHLAACVGVAAAREREQAAVDVDGVERVPVRSADRDPPPAEARQLDQLGCARASVSACAAVSAWRPRSSTPTTPSTGASFASDDERVPLASEQRRRERARGARRGRACELVAARVEEHERIGSAQHAGEATVVEGDDVAGIGTERRVARRERRPISGCAQRGLVVLEGDEVGLDGIEGGAGTSASRARQLALMPTAAAHAMHAKSVRRSFTRSSCARGRRWTSARGRARRWR